MTLKNCRCMSSSLSGLDLFAYASHIVDHSSPAHFTGLVSQKISVPTAMMQSPGRSPWPWTHVPHDAMHGGSITRNRAWIGFGHVAGDVFDGVVRGRMCVLSWLLTTVNDRHRRGNAGTIDQQAISPVPIRAEMTKSITAQPEAGKMWSIHRWRARPGRCRFFIHRLHGPSIDVSVQKRIGLVGRKAYF
jgi:hypothetical protein